MHQHYVCHRLSRPFKFILSMTYPAFLSAHVLQLFKQYFIYVWSLLSFFFYFRLCLLNGKGYVHAPVGAPSKRWKPSSKTAPVPKRTALANVDGQASAGSQSAINLLPAVIVQLVSKVTDEVTKRLAHPPPPL